MNRPRGVAAVACVLLLWGTYICAVSLVGMIASGAIKVIGAAPMVRQLMRIKPYWSLIIGIGWAFVGWGLLHLRNWARWIAMIGLGLSTAFTLLPLLSPRMHSGWRDVIIALETVLKGAAAIYLAQSEAVLNAFVGKKPS